MVGTRVSHYEILERLGGGGMGVVYKALDLKLDRPVALKFLPPNLTCIPESSQRFVHEAKAASALQHNNICVVHDIDETPQGELFICMEYIDGKTLKKRIADKDVSIQEGIEIALQVAQGLAKAHAHGIVHRDIKPANIIVTTDGVAKIVDFGLAKLADSTGMTKAGTTMGTAAYMSPEQVKCEEVDHRTDIWSLGVVLFEMVTGHLPFRGDHEAALCYAIVYEPPIAMKEQPGEGLSGLQGIIVRCLEKEKEKRYGSAEELISALRQLQQAPQASGTGQGTGGASRGLRGTARLRRATRPLIAGGILLAAAAILAYILLRPGPASGPGKSVAVLPFVDISQERDQEYFCDGMTEELINRLSNVKQLKVPARTSVFAFKGASLDIKEIGKRLDVQTVLEGSVRRSGDRLRISAQLVTVSNAFHLWSQQYDREMKDVFAIQSDVAQQITSALDATLSPAEKDKLERRPTANLEAYNLYLRGRFLWRKRTVGDLQEAVTCFESAIGLDSGYAPAYVGLADCYGVFPFYHVPGMSREEAYRRAEASARRALNLDPGLAEAHTALANIRKDGYWDWAGAEVEFKQAIELNPRYATARQWYSENLMIQGRRAEALAEARQAFELEPSSAIIGNNLGLQLLMDRQYDQAIAQFKKSIELDPTHPSLHLSLASAYLMISAPRQAAAEFERTGAPSELLELGLDALRDSTRKAEATARLDTFAAQHREIPASTLARVYAMLGDRNKTFEWLAKACTAHEPEILYIIRHPILEKFLPDARYAGILQRMGL